MGFFLPVTQPNHVNKSSTWKKLVVLLILFILILILIYVSGPGLFNFGIIKENLNPLTLPSPEKLISISGTNSEIQLERISEETKICNFSWNYKFYTWNWEVKTPNTLYQYFSHLERSKVDNYAIYVIHPLHSEAINLICEQLEKICKSKKFNQTQRAEFYANFVRSTQYLAESNNSSIREYPKYPIETLYENGGDCEDKSILLAALLDSAGFKAALIELPQHMIVGVADNSISGRYFVEEGGDKYYALDATNLGWGIGEIAPKYSDASLRIRLIKSTPIIFQTFSAKLVDYNLILTVTVQNIGNADGESLIIRAGFDASNNQMWNPQESSSFDLKIGEEKTINITLRLPYGKHTRLIVQAIDDGLIVDTKYSDWRDL